MHGIDPGGSVTISPSYLPGRDVRDISYLMYRYAMLCCLHMNDMLGLISVVGHMVYRTVYTVWVSRSE
jgi:hypothetical protein